MSVASFIRPREAARIEALEAENALLRARVVEAERLAFAGDWTAPAEWGLTAAQERIFGLLLSRERATKAQMASASWSLRPDCDVPDPKTIDVQLSLMRRKLKPFGIEIRTLWGRGYALDAGERARLRGAPK